MATKSADGYEHYYVPEQSAFPILATVGLFFTVFGAATFFNEIQSGDSGIGGYLSLFIMLC